ncbi:Fis family transcriptional regulator [Ningiella sp. W23]|uniref:Fis family transcriptional regulator n=1 Tax=Ningiella sp. W23 TaxID=3023715 RepID=UPI003758464F
MRKSEKKLEKRLIKALTQVCEQAKFDLTGFQWLTHRADFSRFPQSLMVHCIFDTKASMTTGNADTDLQHYFAQAIESNMVQVGIEFTGSERDHAMINRVILDNEEDCQAQHSGNWNKRIHHAH